MKFDMKTARHHADTGDLMKTTKVLYAALDEIERLHAELKNVTEDHKMALHEQLSVQLTKIHQLEESNHYLGEKWVKQACIIEEMRKGNQVFDMEDHLVRYRYRLQVAQR